MTGGCCHLAAFLIEEEVYCTFGSGSYRVTTQPNAPTECLAQKASVPLQSFAFEIQMTITSGYSGGLLFGSMQGVRYRFYVDHNGYYTLFHHTPTQGEPIVCDTSANIVCLSSVFKTGYDQTNTLGVIVQGSQIDLYINQHLVFHTSSNDLPNSGTVGVLAVYFNRGSEGAFYDAELWVLS